METHRREKCALRTNASPCAERMVASAADTNESKCLNMPIPVVRARKRRAHCKKRPWLTIAFQVCFRANFRIIAVASVYNTIVYAKQLSVM